MGWGEERGKDQSWKTKSEVARGVADFRVCTSHVACDSMQGLTCSARGTDGPAQYLCMHVCAFRLHASLSIICLFTYSLLEVNVENSSFNLINYHKRLRKMRTRLFTHTYTQVGHGNIQ